MQHAFVYSLRLDGTALGAAHLPCASILATTENWKGSLLHFSSAASSALHASLPHGSPISHSYLYTCPTLTALPKPYCLPARRQVGSIVNFALMYLLAPTGSTATSTAGMSLFQKMFSETTLKNMGAPGAWHAGRLQL